MSRSLSRFIHILIISPSLYHYHSVLVSNIMATTRLPILPLPHPLILLPSARASIPVPRSLGEQLLSLIEDSDALPIVAAVPESPEGTALGEWGTASRVLRLVRQPSSRSYLLSLQGLTRIKRKSPGNVQALSLEDVEYPSQDKLPPSKENVERFKQSASRLLERLSRDSVQVSRKEGYAKILAMLEEVQDARAPWMADVLVGTVNVEYEDRLGAYIDSRHGVRLTSRKPSWPRPTPTLVYRKPPPSSSSKPRSRKCRARLPVRLTRACQSSRRNSSFGNNCKPFSVSCKPCSASQAIIPVIHRNPYFPQDPQVLTRATQANQAELRAASWTTMSKPRPMTSRTSSAASRLWL